VKGFAFARHPGESRDPAFRSDHGDLSEGQRLDPGFRRDDDPKIQAISIF
jgi:hypothetical protein